MEISKLLEKEYNFSLLSYFAGDEPAGIKVNGEDVCRFDCRFYNLTKDELKSIAHLFLHSYEIFKENIALKKSVEQLNKVCDTNSHILRQYNDLVTAKEIEIARLKGELA